MGKTLYIVSVEKLTSGKTKLSEPKSDVRKSVHHHTIQINQPKICNSFTSLLLDVYVWLNMFRAPPRPSSGAYNCTRSLWFYRWKVAVGALLAVGLDHSQQRYNVSTTRPTTFHVCKTRGYQCSFRLLMMGGVSPETC